MPSRSLPGRMRLAETSAGLVDEPDALRRITLAAMVQRESAMVLRCDVTEALDDGWSWHQVAAAARMPVATLHRQMGKTDAQGITVRS